MSQIPIKFLLDTGHWGCKDKQDADTPSRRLHIPADTVCPNHVILRSSMQRTRQSVCGPRGREELVQLEKSSKALRNEYDLTGIEGSAALCNPVTCSGGEGD